MSASFQDWKNKHKNPQFPKDTYNYHLDTSLRKQTKLERILALIKRLLWIR